MKKVLFAIAFTIVTLVATSCKRAETTQNDSLVLDSISVQLDSAQLAAIKADTIVVDSVNVDTIK